MASTRNTFKNSKEYLDETNLLIKALDERRANLKSNRKINRESIEEKFSKAHLMVLKNKKKFLESKGMQVLHFDKQKREAYKLELIKDFSKLNHEELLDKCAEITLDMLMYQMTSRYLDAESNYLKKIFNESWTNRLNTVTKQKQGKDLTFKSNNEYLRHCLDQLTENGTKAIKSTDFIRFSNLANKQPPPFIQKLRQTKAEKNQPEEIQRIDAEALARHEWAPTTLRNFFEKHTGVKPSSIRK